MKAFNNFQSLHSSPSVVDSPFDNHEGGLHLVLKALVPLLNKNYRNSEHLSGETTATYSHTLLAIIYLQCISYQESFIDLKFALVGRIKTCLFNTTQRKD